MATVANRRRPSQPSPKPAPVVTLALAIDHIVYAVEPIRGLQDPDIIRAFRLEKKSDRDAVYDVSRTALGFVACTCPDYVARQEGNGFGMCKHGRALVEMGLLDAPLAPVIPPPIPAPAAVGAGDEAARALESGGFHPAIAKFLGGIPEVAAIVAPEPPPVPTEATPGPDAGAEAEGDPDDDEGDPADWPAWVDADRWEADGGAVALVVDPPGPTGGLTLLEWVASVAAGFRDLDTAAADLVAEAVEQLARGIRATGAHDPATYRDRIDFA